jgi:signal transduction histidine kinase
MTAPPLSTAEPVNILLVDDQPAKLLSYEVILGELGERLIKASSAREALNHLLKNDVAVVLIDVQMPELDGFELAAMIREHPRFQQTALIFVSAIHLSELDRLRGYEAGAVDYVPVPVVPEVLRAKVRVFADLHRKTRELEWLNARLEQRVEERTAALEESRRALQQLNEELEARIEERTREREQAIAQLFEAQKIDTIGQLTGGVAHDFNNLLMAVMGSLQMLRKRIDDPRSVRLLENAMQGAERGAALTQRLLAFARRQELRPEAVDVQNLVSGMRDLLGRSLGPAVSLSQNVDAAVSRVCVDANQLELALLNLAVNARDAMPLGGVVTISAADETITEMDAVPGLKPGDYVRLSVSDTGEGMDDEVLARAAEPFFTTKGVGKGTGLGLSMVHGLAAQSGGALRLSSRLGEGSRIDLWLPATLDPIADKPFSAQTATSAPCASLRILLVDDDPLVSTGTAAMLEDLGHVVREAASADLALTALAEDRSFDLVITDHAMPGMTGLQLAQRLREIHPELPVVLASGYADLPTSGAEALDLPRLIKPFPQSEVAKLIADHFQAKPPQAGRSPSAFGPQRQGGLSLASGTASPV